MKKSVAIVLSLLLVIPVLFTGCGNNTTTYADGTFEGMSSKDDHGGYGVVTITVTEGEISDCTYVEYTDEDIVKDETYCADLGEDLYAAGQLAVEGMKDYPIQFMENKDIEQVDAVTGATTSHGHFVEAAEIALASAVEAVE